MNNWVKARGYLVFIIGLTMAFGLVVWVEHLSGKELIDREPLVSMSANRPGVVPPRELTEQEEQWARIAWRYFQNNTRAETGLVDSVEKYPAATMWDTASYLLALLSARDIGVVSPDEFGERMVNVLHSLGQMPLFEDSLPNKSYSTITLQMVDYTNRPTPQGIGWSAIDVGRLLVPFNIIVWKYPEHAADVRDVLSRWDTQRLVNRGEFMGARASSNGTKFLQEGRLGYEQYAAKTYVLMGLDATRAINYTNHLSYIDIYGIEVPYDNRDPRLYGAHNYVVSEPYVLDGLEFGWDSVSAELAWRVYRAQEERHRQTAVLTAVSEDHLDQAPHFVYNTVFSDGKRWNAITDEGVDASAFRTLSVKTAFAWYALYRSPYTGRLIEAVTNLHDSQRGWYAGLYERTGKPNKALTTNTNAVILESLAYIRHGRLIRYGQEPPMSTVTSP